MKILTLTCVVIFASFVNGCWSSGSKSRGKTDGPICNNCNVGPPSGSNNNNKGGPICNNCEIGPPSGPADPNKVVKKPEYGPDCECIGTTCYHCDIGK